METFIKAQLKTGKALEIGQFIVVEMHGGSQPEMWWIFNEDYELIVLGSESVRAYWLKEHGEDLPSHFNSLQEAIDDVVIRIKTEAKVAARIQLGYEPVQRFDKEEKIKK